MTPKLCLTTSACLIRENKVLLVKHKKLDKWLAPGGHIDNNELPHLAAEREFLEETGLKVKVFSAAEMIEITDENHDFFHPLPFAINEHWICKENYENRLIAEKNQSQIFVNKLWSKGCEKHLNFCYLVKLTGPLEIKPQKGESQEISWFSIEDLRGKYKDELVNSVLEEVTKAFDLAKSSHS